MKTLPVHSGAAQRAQLETASWFAVVKAYLECSRRYTQMLQHIDLTVAQYDALRVIDTLGEDAVPKAIADRLLVSRANVTGVIRRLQERGLIEARPHGEDGRSIVCTPTDAGRALTGRADAAAKRFIRAQLKPFTDSQLQDMEDVMRKMQAHLQTLDPAVLAASDT